MRQNRSNITTKGQKSKPSQINLLKDDLLLKINNFQQTKTNFKQPSSSQKISKNNFSSINDDLQVISFEKTKQPIKSQKQKSILQKAKQITLANREQIESAKKNYKKSNPQNQGMFLTGCGLYRAQIQQQQIKQDFQSVDLNDALKFLVSHEKDDLQQLRRMINKASFDIRQYSQEITKTTSTVSNAADLFGKQFNTDLRIKVNRCKPIENDVYNLPSNKQIVKRKISTSSKQRSKHIY